MSYDIVKLLCPDIDSSLMLIISISLLRIPIQHQYLLVVKVIVLSSGKWEQNNVTIPKSVTWTFYISSD